MKIFLQILLVILKNKLKAKKTKILKVQDLWAK